MGKKAYPKSFPEGKDSETQEAASIGETKNEIFNHKNRKIMKKIITMTMLALLTLACTSKIESYKFLDEEHKSFM